MFLSRNHDHYSRSFKNLVVSSCMWELLSLYCTTVYHSTEGKVNLLMDERLLLVKAQDVTINGIPLNRLASFLSRSRCTLPSGWYGKKLF